MVKRIEWIDSLKGLAIVLVVIGHIADGYIDAHSFPNSENILMGIFNGIYIFHMALFFTISGMTYQIAYISNSYGHKNKNKRIKIQLINLMMLYIEYCIINWVFKLTLSRFVNKQVSITDILAIWAKPIYPYWFFYVLIVLYMIFRLDIFKKNSNMILFVLFMISLFSGYVKVGEWFQVTHILFFALFFYIGIMYMTDKKNWLFSGPVTVIFFIISIVTSILWWNKETIIYWTPMINCISALGIVLILVFAFSHMISMEKSRVLNYLGKHSLEIYVIHCFLTAGNRVVLPKLGVASIELSFLLNLIISISVPIAISVITKKIGIYNYFFAPYQLIKREEV